MNSLSLSNLEILMEERRADFRREMEQLQLEREAMSTKERKPNWVIHGMQALSACMIAIGEQLRRRNHNSTPVPRSYQSFKVAK